MCQLYLSTAGDDAPDTLAEIERGAAADAAVYGALTSLQLALIQQTGIGTQLAAGRTDADLDKRIVDAERAVAEAFERFNVALCAQARGAPYRLLEASHGGVARSMRHRLAQSRRVAAVEAHAARYPSDSARVA